MKILNRLFTDMKVDNTKTTYINRQIESNKEMTKYTKEDAKIKALFTKHNKELSKNVLSEIKLFVSKTDGSLESKLKTIDASLSKGIEMTADNLNAVHEALIGDVIKEAGVKPMNLKKVYASLPEGLKNIIDTKVKEGLSFEEAIKVVLQNTLKEVYINADSLLNDKASEKIDVIKIFNEAERDHLSQLIRTNNIKLSSINNDEEADVKSKDDYKKIENDLETIERIEKALEGIEEDIEGIFDKIDGHIDVHQLVEFESNHSFKKVIRTEITEKMVELKQTFNDYKQAITKQLDGLINDKPIVLNMKETLNSVIDKLDDILMKSDITLHTDMKTERDLLASSSKLDDARVLLDKNHSKAAIEIVKEVKSMIDRIDFKPSSQKIFGVSQKLFLDKLYEENIIKSMPLNINTDSQVSPRAILELFRNMGLNHETEVSELIRKEKAVDGLKYTQNMKTILMKLEEDVTHRVSAREGLENLTGQQLMNKLEYKSQKQKLLFNMPIKIDNGIKNLKIHVNARKENQKIDWKNSTLYFVVQLDKLGDTGILVDINNGQVNLTIKNDSPDTESKIQPYLKSAIERLEGIGLNHFNLNFDSLNKEKEVVKASIKQAVKESKKEGFDFKI